MNIRWGDAARHALQVAAFCCAVAVLTTSIWPNRTYWEQVGSAMCIGFTTWGVIEFGRYLVDERHCHRDGSGGHGWPMGWRGVTLTGIGILCGFFFGSRLSDLAFGSSVGYSSRDGVIGLVITVLSGVVASAYFHSRGRAAALAAKANAAERDASEAKLKLLETQLEPHMLFNTLANLRALIATDPPRAVAMLDHLNNYLRMTLAGSRSLSHPLSAEFERLGDYLELMSVRMGPRLRYRLDLPDELRDVPVPPLMLQPLVENSIRHGLEPQVEGGEIAVRARRDGARLVIEVRDTGVGVEAGTTSSAGGGFGLAQVRERLATVYGTRSTMELNATAEGGTCAAIAFPLSSP
ncbi:sensor histidine kinase [Variovorax sp. PBL-E5]|uniref:sensor histidine kinase n=1 Tax=Variovorax sp. PBL-E5 TaxID=434014 RepID=UPI001316F440|nr:histidine kinase [Variovorax sp. PBL-E5]VTU32179.1 Sensor histidine kinase YehU [Variovorax sp. PBL-E5]